MDYEQHNTEVREVWEAYHRGQPIRVPMILGINPRFTMFDHPANPSKMTFQQYSEDPQKMLERQCEHQEWVRLHVPQDAEMGMLAAWNIYVDLQNYFEAGWLGCRVVYYDDQVPDTEPLLQDDSSKRLLFDQGIPDPFEGGLMARNWEFTEYFQRKKEEGFTWKGIPIGSVTPTALGTDGPMTVACNLRGTTEFCMDLLLDPDYARELLDFVTEAAIQRIQAYRKRLGQPLTGAGWGFADDSIQLLSEDTYREMILPYHRKLVDTFSEGGPNSIHLCGDATRHFPMLQKELNIQAYDTGFPVDFSWLRQTLGPDVTIHGGPSVALLRESSPESVRKLVKQILGSGIMQGGRFILREGNNLAPGVPLENLWAMYNACREFGRYV